MDYEDAKKVARAAFAADGGCCASCVTDVINSLFEQLPQFDWGAIAEEVAQETIHVEPNGEVLLRMDYFTYDRSMGHG